MKILFIGDIVGRRGRRSVSRLLPGLKNEFRLDLVLGNAENAAGGLGATAPVMDELVRSGVHGMTLGNHTWRKKELADALRRYPNVARPVNYPPGVPGQGSFMLDVAGVPVAVVSVIGRVFMEAFACPFATARAELERLRERAQVIIVDFHAEATSEKVALGWYLDGRCSAVLGTHTHVQTADERILPGGTAYITDLGMTGPVDSVIGIERERAIGKFLTGMPSEFKVAKGPARLCGVVVDVDESTGRARGIERIARLDDDFDLDIGGDD
jgi:2',3'-cyclic-nucleotide 2'-phosphodiesterase